MPQFSTRHTVVHTPEQMFDLVADVEQYPRFLPLCQRLHIRGRRQDDDGREVLIADMTASYAMFRETFSTRVLLDRPNMAIDVAYLSGPFRHLDNAWRFHPADGGGCRIDFDIAYEFKSRTLGTLMTTVFDRAFRRFVTAFEARADALYGEGTGRAPAVESG